MANLRRSGSLATTSSGHTIVPRRMPHYTHQASPTSLGSRSKRSDRKRGPMVRALPRRRIAAVRVGTVGLPHCTTATVAVYPVSANRRLRRRFDFTHSCGCRVRRLLPARRLLSPTNSLGFECLREAASWSSIRTTGTCSRIGAGACVSAIPRWDALYGTFAYTTTRRRKMQLGQNRAGMLASGAARIALWAPHDCSRWWRLRFAQVLEHGGLRRLGFFWLPATR